MSSAAFLLSPEGRHWTAAAAGVVGETARVLWLRRQGLSQEQASAVVSLLEVRQRAARRFSDADRLFFTGESLAQATSPGIAAYHAAALAPLAASGQVADLGCGVGMDSIALAEAGARVLALDKDPERLLFARANAGARGVADRITFVESDVTRLEWEADAVYWDPSRRDSERRYSRQADRYEPPLQFLHSFRDRVRGGALKLSPALPDETLEEVGGRVEFLSEGRECKEACIWFGEARGAGGAAPWTAVLLPERLAISGKAAAPRVGAMGAFLFDPDPALIRAQALGELAQREGAGLLSPDDAYLSGDSLLPPRLASAYRIQEEMVYRPRAMAAYLKAEGIGRLVIKKRYFGLEPQAICRELGLPPAGEGKGATREATLVLVREGKRFRAFICQPERQSS